jgi:hypothetical protein
MLLALPDNFFTPESMTTLAGATAITWIVSNAVQAAFNLNPKWLALVIALAVCFVGTMLKDTHTNSDFFVAFINGCLVYLTAVGTSTLPARAGAAGASPQPAVVGGPKPAAALGGPEKRGFLDPWL